MMNILAKITQHKMVAFSLIASSLWCMYDFQHRFIVDNVSKSLNTTQVLSKNVLPVVIDNKKQKAVLALYRNYYNDTESKVATENKTPGLSIEEQNKQQGFLREVFVDDFKIELKAILNQSQKKAEVTKALLLVENLKTGIKKIETYINNENVYGYKLTINKRTQVVLTKINETTEQHITLTMYQPIAE